MVLNNISLDLVYMRQFNVGILNSDLTQFINDIKVVS